MVKCIYHTEDVHARDIDVVTMACTISVNTHPTPKHPTHYGDVATLDLGLLTDDIMNAVNER